VTVADQIAAEYRKGRSARSIAASLRISDSDVRAGLTAQARRAREFSALSRERRRQPLAEGEAAAGDAAAAAPRLRTGDTAGAAEARGGSHGHSGNSPSRRAPFPFQGEPPGLAEAEGEWQLGMAAAAAFIEATGRRWPGPGRPTLAPGGPTLLEWLLAQSRARKNGTLPNEHLLDLQTLGYFGNPVA
jgi:hypothetical protein